jgi:hypothetical protein
VVAHGPVILAADGFCGQAQDERRQHNIVFAVRGQESLDLVRLPADGGDAPTLHPFRKESTPGRRVTAPSGSPECLRTGGRPFPGEGTLSRGEVRQRGRTARSR